MTYLPTHYTTTPYQSGKEDTFPHTYCALDVDVDVRVKNNTQYITTSPTGRTPIGEKYETAVYHMTYLPNHYTTTPYQSGKEDTFPHTYCTLEVDVDVRVKNNIHYHITTSPTSASRLYPVYYECHRAHTFNSMTIKQKHTCL
jgi:hypothetical protein